MAGCMLYVLPFIWMLFTSFMAEDEYFQKSLMPVPQIPKNIKISPYLVYHDNENRKFLNRELKDINNIKGISINNTEGTKFLFLGIGSPLLETKNNYIKPLKYLDGPVGGIGNSWAGEYENKSYTGIPYDLANKKSIRFSLNCELDESVNNIENIKIPLVADRSYNKITFYIKVDNKMYKSNRDFYLDNYFWQDVTLSFVPLKKIAPQKFELVKTEFSKSDSLGIGSRQLSVIMVLHKVSFFGKIINKFFNNYKLSFLYINFWRMVWNSFYITFLSILGQVLSCSLAAFAFSRLKWPGRDLIFAILLSSMMLPPQVTMIPQFLTWKFFGFYDTLKPLWVGSFFGNPFFIFLLRQFFLGIPDDLQDAARIDGCGYFRIYWNIMMPLLKPALCVVAIFQFMASWSDFMGPLIYVNSMEITPLSLGLFIFKTAHGANWGLLMAVSTLACIPSMILFFSAQKYFIQGVTLTGIRQ